MALRSSMKAIHFIPKGLSSFQPIKNILVPVRLPTGPQLFLLNSGVWGQQQQQQQQQPKRDDIGVTDDAVPDPTLPVIKKEEFEYESHFSDHEAPKLRIINSDTPLPEFSESIRTHLKENNLSAVWGAFIDECAKYYYDAFPNIQNSSEYQAIGRKMYRVYPAIQCEGKEPWSFFCKSLSQKIRHIKWKMKRKMLGMTTRRARKSGPKRPIKPTKLRTLAPRKIDRRYTQGKQYRALLKELSEGWRSKTISDSRLREILRLTIKNRRLWLSSHPENSLSRVKVEYPCFSEAKYVVGDFLQMINKEDTSHMLKSFESLFCAVGSVMDPPLDSSDFTQQVEILKYLEDQVAFHKGKSSFSRSILIHKIGIPEDEMMSHVQTLTDSPPVLFVFSDGCSLQKAIIGGDRSVIDTEAGTLFEALVVLIATYYTFSIQYPKSFSQILGVFQTYVVGESYEGIKSNRCNMFIKNLAKNFVLGE